MNEHSVPATEKISKGNTALFMVGMIWVAFNLRPAITSVGPLIGEIRQDLGISNGLAGLLTTLPVLGFALFSLLAPKIGNHLGNERTVFLGLIILTSGIVIRSSGPIAAVFTGTALIGVGVAIGNVLLPGIVKHRFPEKTGMMTSIYSTSMGLFAAIASGVSIPLSRGLHLGWRRALLLWGIVGVIALLLWVAQLGRKSPPISRDLQKTPSPCGDLPLPGKSVFLWGCSPFFFIALSPGFLKS